MITTCNNCGGLRAEPGEMYAGKPCECGVNENKVTPSEPSQSERELAERIYEYIQSPPGPSLLVETERIAQLIHAENERQREVLVMTQSALARFNENYEGELESCDRQIKWCEKHNDTHGVNFHQGRRSGIISNGISLTKLKEAAVRLNQLLK